MRAVITATFVAILLTAGTAATRAGTKVDFAPDGTCRIGGTPFFPIGVWTYSLDAAVMADLHEHRFNTIVGGGFQPGDLPLIEKHGMMCIPIISDEWLKAAKDSPSLLAWELIDEPEEHKTPPAEVKKRYVEMKARDRDHPVGITHNQNIEQVPYKDALDFSMTDIYPVDAKRVWPLKVVGEHTSYPREIHGAGWPNFTIVQTFGGPDTDGGIWAQPLPHEVRFMVFDALVNRANGIVYFSYWPRAPITWAGVAQLNRDLERIVPRLLAPGEERPTKSTDDRVEARARKLASGGWLIVAVNTSPLSCDVTLTIGGLANAALASPYEHRTLRAKDGAWREHFAPYQERVYLVGDEPDGP